MRGIKFVMIEFLLIIVFQLGTIRLRLRRKNMVLTNWDHTMVSVQKLDSGIKTFADNGIIFELGDRHDA